MENLKLCRVCGGRLRSHWERPRFLACEACDAIWKDPFPTEEELFQLYSTAWTDPERNSAETSSGSSSYLADQYVQKLVESTGVGTLAGLKILEFGAGTGVLLTALEKSGADVTGVEPYGIEAIAKLGRKVYTTLGEVPAGECFDGIACFDVVEHLRDPSMELSALRTLLKPGGWLLVSTPNPKGVNARIHGARWREAQKAGHINFLSEKALCRAFRAAGYSRSLPVRWTINYRPRSWLSNRVGWVLQLLGLDGAARVIGYR